MMTNPPALEIVVFETSLGWMAIVGRDDMVSLVTFGQSSAAATRAAAERALKTRLCPRDWCPILVRRLEDYADGAAVGFRDVELDLGHLTSFQQRVIKHCRAIPYGESRTYGELARASGKPGAARAVGTTMAQTRFPILVPCHRVVPAGRKLGGARANASQRKRARLLAMERRTLAG